MWSLQCTVYTVRKPQHSIVVAGVNVILAFIVVLVGFVFIIVVVDVVFLAVTLEAQPSLWIVIIPTRLSDRMMVQFLCS